MAAPDVQINIQDPGLGIVPASAGRTQVKLGAAQKGTPNTVYAVSSIQAARELVGSGPMLDAIAQVLTVAGGPVLVVPLGLTDDGAVTGAFTLSGVGTGTVTGSRGPEEIVKVKIINGAALGATLTYQVAVGAGAYGPTTPAAANPYQPRVPGQYFTKLAFGNVTYTTGDVYQLELDGTVARTGAGPATALDGSISSPVDGYDVWVEITTSGALGLSTFRYSLDGGNNWSASIPTMAKYPIPGAGVVLAFAGDFTVGDLYKGVASPPGFTAGDVTAGYTAMRANSSEWGFSHVVATPATATLAAALAGVVGAAMTADQAVFRYGFALVECPQTEGDAEVKTRFASVAQTRVAVSVGDVALISPLTGRRHRRNNAWVLAARLGATKLSTHPGQVAADDNSGPIKNVSAIYPVGDYADLDASRFTTVRTMIGQQGYFFTRGRLMAPAGSDFAYVQNRRVMDRACTVARSALTLFLNKSVRLSETTGFIDERDAIGIESVVGAKLRAALVAEDEASSVAVSVSRTDNILSTGTINVEISVIPKGYLETIRTTIGFQNPALEAA